MKIYTSYFARVKRLKEANIKPVGIAILPPTYYFGAHYKQLAPRKEMLKMSIPDYDREFYKILDSLNPHQVLKDLTEISNGQDIALLCFEKNPIECHRSMVAKWLEDTLHIEVKEFEVANSKDSGIQLMMF